MADRLEVAAAELDAKATLLRDEAAHLRRSPQDPVRRDQDAVALLRAMRSLTLAGRSMTNLANQLAASAYNPDGGVSGRKIADALGVCMNTALKRVRAHREGERDE